MGTLPVRQSGSSKQSMAAKKWINVVLADPSERSVQSVADQCAAQGLEKMEVLETLGLITGAASAAQIARLRRLRGVRAVEEAGEVEIPDPGAPVQ